MSSACRKYTDPAITLQVTATQWQPWMWQGKIIAESSKDGL
jgi:hypothetical protein